MPSKIERKEAGVKRGKLVSAVSVESMKYPPSCAHAVLYDIYDSHGTARRRRNSTGGGSNKEGKKKSKYIPVAAAVAVAVR